MAIEADYMRYSLLRDLGRGPAFPLSANLPGGLQSGDRFYRTDLNWPCYWDGARWLTIHEYTTILTAADGGSFTDSFAATKSNARLGQLRRDYQQFIMRVEFLLFVSTTNSAVNYWTVVMRDSSATAIITDSTAANAPNTNIAKAYTNLTISQISATRDFLYLDLTTNGAPGAIQPRNPLVYYRLVVT